MVVLCTNYIVIKGSSVAEWPGRWSCNLEAPSPTLTANSFLSWGCVLVQFFSEKF